MTLGVDVDSVDFEYEESPGHFVEWVDAIDGGPEAISNFPDYAGPLSETILLGNLAVWSGEKVNWDPKALRPLNAPHLEPLVRHEYRDGWTLYEPEAVGV